MNAIRVLLADDHPAVRQGVRLLLHASGDFAVVGEAANGAEAAELAREQLPDVVVMDARMPVLDGIEATRRIVSWSPNARVLVLSAEPDVEQRARHAGAVGFLNKSQCASILPIALRMIVEEGDFFAAPA